jgi:hypothetical protein
VDEQGKRLAIKALDAGTFELLVNELAYAAFSGDGRQVRKMRAPDDGADSLILDARDHVVGVLQAKRHVRAIKWDDCSKSLDDAVATWSPDEVIFAFPVDFSAANQHAFAELKARHPGVRVQAWELATLMRMLAEHPQVAPRFLGAGTRSIQDTVARTMKLGGAALETASDIVARSLEIGAACDEVDPYFRLNQTSGPVPIPEPHWAELPYLSLEIAGQHAYSRIDAWARQEAGIDLPAWDFTDDEDGQRAREHARVAMARGERVEINEGMRVTLPRAPKVVHELVGPKPHGRGTLTIQPVDPVPCKVVIHADTTVAHDFELRPVYPQPGADVAFAAEQHGVWFELGLRFPGPPKVQLSISLTPRLSSSAAANAHAVELAIAFLTCTRITINAAGLLPEEGVDGAMNVPKDTELLEDLRHRAMVYRDLAFIERELNIDLPILGPIEPEDILAIGTIAAALETGEGTATMQQAHKVVAVSEIAGLPEQFAREQTPDLEVTYPLFGREISLGMGTYDLPEVKIIDIRPLADSPHAPARVMLGPDGDDQMAYRLHRGAAPA